MTVLDSRPSQQNATIWGGWGNAFVIAQSQMSPEQLQILFRVLIGVFTMLAVLAGLGDFYFGRQVEQQRREASAKDAAARNLKSDKHHKQTSKALSALGSQGRRQQEENREQHNETRDAIAAAKDDLLQALAEKEKSLDAVLWEKYPWGFVLFGLERGDIVSLPLKKREIDGKTVHFEADWNLAELRISDDKQMAHFTIPDVSWWVEGGGLNVRNLQLDLVFPLVRGEPNFMGSGFFLKGNPQLYVEVIDANPARPVFAVGFREPTDDELPGRHRKKVM